MDDDPILVRKLQKELNAGTVSLILLALLERTTRPMYGYEIARRLEQAAGGSSPIKQGTVYPVLRSMEGNGLLESEVEPSVSGPPRRYYTITARGRDTLGAWREAWVRTRTLVDAVLEGVAAGAAKGNGDA